MSRFLGLNYNISCLFSNSSNSSSGMNKKPIGSGPTENRLGLIWSKADQEQVRLDGQRESTYLACKYGLT